MVPKNTFYPICCGISHNDWGKLGRDSLVAKLAVAGKHCTSTVVDDVPYAELWIGSHVSHPSCVRQRDKEMAQELALTTPATTSESKEVPEIPFLLKVLSIRKALAVQAHPSLYLASELHARDSANYLEIAIALTPFELLHNFRPLWEIAVFLDTVKPFRKLVGAPLALRIQQYVASRSGKGHDYDSDSPTVKGLLQGLFTTIVDACLCDIETHTKHLLLLAQSVLDRETRCASDLFNFRLATLILTLHKDYHCDAGLFIPFLMNFTCLSPGEAIFLAPGDIHAYLSGDIVECMASSSNVLRAAFTSKLKDTRTMAEMLSYKSVDFENFLERPAYQVPVHVPCGNPATSSSSCVVFDPPANEFKVFFLRLHDAGDMVRFPAIENSNAVLLCISGSCDLFWKEQLGSTTERIAAKTGEVILIKILDVMQDLCLQNSGIGLLLAVVAAR